MEKSNTYLAQGGVDHAPRSGTRFAMFWPVTMTTSIEQKNSNHSRRMKDLGE